MSAFNQIRSEVDNCVYFFDTEKRIWRKICDVGDGSALPLDVKTELRKRVDEAKALLEVLGE